MEDKERTDKNSESIKKHTETETFLQSIGNLRDMAISLDHKARQQIKKVVDLEERINQIMAPALNALKNVEQYLTSINFHERLLELREAADVYQESTIKFKTIIVEAGFPPSSEMPLIDTIRIVDIYDRKGIEYTTRFINRYLSLYVFDEEFIRSIQKSWRSADWLYSRQEILDKVIEGHFKNFYELTVPTILAQIEGIIIDGMLAIGEAKAGDKISYKMQKSFLSAVLLNDMDTFSFDEEIENIYTGTVLAGFERGGEIPSSLSRHAILHGEDTKYGTKLNSLKAILIFDYFFHKLDKLYASLEKQ